MKYIYFISLIYLILSFLLYKKKESKISVVCSIIFSVGLLFCYNTIIVCLYSWLKIKGSLLLLSTLNIIIGSIFSFNIFKRKEIQKYSFDKKEFLSIFLLFIIVFLIGFIRFRGFNGISYETGDPATHYRTSLYFAKELNLMTIENSKDLVWGNFYRFMPISYINSGIMINIFTNIDSYRVFLIYDVICFCLSTLLFFITIKQIVEEKKKNNIYSFILTLIYSLGFPLNNLIFGFCYLGLGIMVINLLFLLIYNIKDFNENKLFKIILLFILSFSVFFSYYLFIPPIYLALGIYYIYLWKNKKLTQKNLFIYGIITLIIPFLIGFSYFMLPGFLGNTKGNIFTNINLPGTIYNNITPMILFFVISIIIIYRQFKLKEKMDYFKFSLYILSFYINLFLILYFFKLSELYYLYKLFYLYWFFVIILLGNLLKKFKPYLYSVFIFILIGMFLTCLISNTNFSMILTKVNIFNWNSRRFLEDRMIFNKEELEIMEASLSYKNICEHKNEFVITGYNFKNLWFYAYTGSIPVYDFGKPNRHNIYTPGYSLNYWNDNFKESPCMIYYYENQKKEYDESNFDILYSNKEGAILKRKAIN